MASGSGVMSYSSTVASVNVVETVLLTGSAFGIEVVNITGTAPIWFTVGEPGGPCPVPTVNGSGSFCAASVAGTQVKVRHQGFAGNVVQLISAGTPAYTVSQLGVRAPD